MAAATLCSSGNHTPPTEGIGISWGGGFCKVKKLKEMYEV